MPYIVQLIIDGILQSVQFLYCILINQNIKCLDQYDSCVQEWDGLTLQEEASGMDIE